MSLFPYAGKVERSLTSVPENIEITPAYEEIIVKRLCFQHFISLTLSVSSRSSCNYFGM